MKSLLYFRKFVHLYVWEIWENSINATPKKLYCHLVFRATNLSQFLYFFYSLECKCKILNFYFFIFSSTVLQSCAQDRVQQNKFSYKFSVVLVHHVLFGDCVHLWNFTHIYDPLHYLDGILKWIFTFFFIK